MRSRCKSTMPCPTARSPPQLIRGGGCDKVEHDRKHRDDGQHGSKTMVLHHEVEPKPIRVARTEEAHGAEAGVRHKLIHRTVGQVRIRTAEILRHIEALRRIARAPSGVGMEVVSCTPVQLLAPLLQELGLASHAYPC